MTAIRRRYIKILAVCVLTLSIALASMIPGIKSGQKLLAADGKVKNENYGAVIGWDGDNDGVTGYMDGSFVIRDGRDKTLSFGIFNNPASLKWYNEEGYLPCLVSEFERNDCTVKIKSFGDKVTINKADYVVIYSRVSIYNHGKSEVALDPAASKELIPLTANSKSIAPGKTVNHDYAIAADRMGKKAAWPKDADISKAGGWDAHYKNMKEYWNKELSQLVQFNKLPDTRLINAFKSGYITMHIIKDGSWLNVGENGYDSVWDHDQVGLTSTMFSIGDFSEAKTWLATLKYTGYPDSTWKNSWPWALYLQKTGDKEYVKKYFNSVIKAKAHSIETDRTGPNKTMKLTWGIDDWGYWTVDNWSALTGLLAYKYICTELGNKAEEAWADSQYKSLLESFNKVIGDTIKTNNLGYIPAAIDMPNDKTKKCADPTNANWASMFHFGRWPWEGYLLNGAQSGPTIDMLDATYDYGFAKLKEKGYPPHNFGGFSGGDNNYSTSYNVAYAGAGLRGAGKYRAEAIYAYQFMLDNTQSGPFSWWEGVGFPEKSPWEGTHPLGGSGSCPHSWGQSFSSKLLTEAIIAEKIDGKVIVGRGVPNEWIAKGKEIDISNYPVTGNRRMGVKIETIGNNQVKLTLSGQAPKGDIIFNLPAFLNNNIKSTTAGKIDKIESAVVLPASAKTVTVTLVKSVKDVKT